MTKRGHRLVYSNGIIVLAGVAMLLVIATGGVVTHLIPLYAIGVFTGFTISQAGMVKHHRTHREPGWRRSTAIQGVGCVLSFAVLVVLAITKFTEGAWVIIVILPVLVVTLLRLNRQYVREAEELEHEVPAAATAPILRRHVVLVFVDRLDAAAARSIQYARSLTPDELRAVHFVIDDAAAQQLSDAWQRLGLSRVPLELVACPDRRLTRAAVECVARELADHETEVSVLLPQRKYKGLWQRILHDKTGEAIQEQVSKLAHANVTTIPFNFGETRAEVGADALLAEVVPLGAHPRVPDPDGTGEAVDLEGIQVAEVDRTRIIDARWRRHVTLVGRVRSVRVAPQHDAPTLEVVLVDDSGAISVVFLGRRAVAGVEVGSRMVIEGTVGTHKARLAILNPTYRLLG
jgi:hypothetical protein